MDTSEFLMVSRFYPWLLRGLVILGLPWILGSCIAETGRWDNPWDDKGTNYAEPRLILKMDTVVYDGTQAVVVPWAVADSNSDTVWVWTTQIGTQDTTFWRISRYSLADSVDSTWTWTPDTLGLWAWEWGLRDKDGLTGKKDTVWVNALNWKSAKRLGADSTLRLAPMPYVIHSAPLSFSPGVYRDSHQLVWRRDSEAWKFTLLKDSAIVLRKLSLGHTYQVFIRSFSAGDSIDSDTLAWNTEPPRAYASIMSGSLVMGSSLESDEGPITTVQVPGLWVARTELTDSAYDALGDLIYPLQILGNTCAGGRCPVRLISFEDAVLYSNKLSKQFYLDTVYAYSSVCALCTDQKLLNLQADSSRWGFRLPTEAEWEYFARGNTPGLWHWGSDSLVASQFAHWNGLSVQAVARLDSNAWGLYDLAGNVWEWVQQDSATYLGGSQGLLWNKNLQGTKVYRGGSWRELSLDPLRLTNRQYALPAEAFDNVGVRLVLQKRP
jgi:formylglycine-generating enzyme required for sulfatase activity